MLQVSRLVACFVLVGSLVTSGCSSPEPNRKKVYPVSGRVLINNKGVAGVVVSFHPKGEVGNPRSQRSFTTTDDEGNFRLTTYETHDGAPEGEYVVTLYWPGKVPPGSPMGEVGPDQLRGRYASPTTSTLTATVRPETNTLEPFKVSLP